MTFAVYFYHAKCYKDEKFHPQWFKSTAHCGGGGSWFGVLFDQVVQVNCVD